MCSFVWIEPLGCILTRGFYGNCRGHRQAFSSVLTGGGGQPGRPTFSSFTTYPREAEDMYRQAEETYRAGKVPNAISLWERIIDKYPSTAIAAKSMNRIGEIYLEQGQPDLAARILITSFTLTPPGTGSPLQNSTNLSSWCRRARKNRR